MHPKQERFFGRFGPKQRGDTTLHTQLVMDSLCCSSGRLTSVFSEHEIKGLEGLARKLMDLLSSAWTSQAGGGCAHLHGIHQPHGRYGGGVGHGSRKCRVVQGLTCILPGSADQNTHRN